MCQSRAEGGRRCPSHHQDTKKVIDRARDTWARDGISTKIYHDIFVDLRRTYRGVEMTEDQRQDMGYEIRYGPNWNITDPREAGETLSDLSDSATLQAQFRMEKVKDLIPDAIDEQITTGLCGSWLHMSASRELFSYVYAHASEYPDPTGLETDKAKAALEGSYLAQLPAAVKAFALIKSGRFFEPSRSNLSSDSEMESTPRISEFVTVRTLPGSSIQVGYAPASLGVNSRLEIILDDSEQTKLCYQNVSTNKFERLLQGGQVARTTIDEIRANPNSRYVDQTSADAAAKNTVERCAYCGQFTGKELHACNEIRIDRDIQLVASTSYSDDVIRRSVAHTDLEGNPVSDPDVVPLPSFNTFQPIGLEGNAIASVEELREMSGLTLLTDELDSRFVTTSQIFELPGAVLDSLRRNEGVPAGYGSEDVVVYQLKDREARLISYFPAGSPLRPMTTPEGVFVQHAGTPPIDDWGREYGYGGAAEELYIDSHINRHDSPFPSAYELSTMHYPEPAENAVDNRDTWSFPDLELIRDALETAPSVGIEFEHRMHVDQESRFLDQDGYAYEPISELSRRRERIQERTVRGRLMLEKEINGDIKVAGFDYAGCSTCRRSPCSHDTYTVRQIPRVLQSLINFSTEEKYDEETGLPQFISANCSVRADEDGKQHLEFGDSVAHQMRNRSRFAVVDSTASNHLEEQVYADRTRAPWPRQLERARQHMNAGDTLTVPLQTNFHNLQTNGFDYVDQVTVEGNVTYKKQADESLVVATRDLQCNCDVYQRNYTCRHIRRLDSRLDMLFDDATRGNDHLNQSRDSRSQQRDQIAAMYIQDRAEALREPIPDLDQALVQRQAEENLSQSERLAMAGRYNAVIFAERIEKERLESLAQFAGYAEQYAKMKERYAPEAFEGPRYTDNYGAFEAEVQEVRRKMKAGEDPLTYETESVLNGIGDDSEHARKFGVELEVVFPEGNRSDRKAVAEALHDAGLSSSGSIGHYHSGQNSGWAKWTAEEDCTVDLEVVSPVMSDTPEGWSQLQEVCDIIKEKGGSVNYKTGSHVHISTGDYGTSVAAHAALLDEFNRYSDLFYRLGSNPETQKHRGTEWCRPNVVPHGETVQRQLHDSGVAYYLNAPHSSAVNFEASGGGTKSHAEVRLWDGSLDPKVIQMQVMLTAAMTEVASHRIDREKPDTFSYTSEPLPLGQGKESTFSSKEEETAPFREMLDRYFPREADRKRFVALWEMTKWQANTRN